MLARAHGAAARLAGFELRAVASRTERRAVEAAAELGSRACTYDELLRGALAADIVVVTTPPHCHAREVSELLERGYAVLVASPLCHTLAEADRLVEVAAQHGDRLWYGEHLVYAPVVQQLLARAGAIGAPTNLEVRYLPALTQQPAPTPDSGIGALFDIGVRPLALALLSANATGAGRPAAVSAELHAAAGNDVSEWLEMRLQYPSGLVARVEAGCHAQSMAVCDAQLASPTGVLRAEIMPIPSLEVNGTAEAVPTAMSEVPALELLGFTGQFARMRTEMRLGTTPAIHADFGRLVLDIMCAATRSAARRGQLEAVPFTGPRTSHPLDIWRQG